MREFTTMSTVVLTRSATPPANTAADADFARPVARPRTSVFKLIGDVLDHGGPGYLQFAITNICNAKCDFCGSRWIGSIPRSAAASRCRRRGT